MSEHDPNPYDNMRHFTGETIAFDIGDGPAMPDEGILKTGRVPVSAYCSQEVFEAETEMFRRVWINLARMEELPKPGDWIVRDIAFLSASILITHGEDGVIRAFHNMCSHRGMRLVWDEEGNSKRFSCPYHAWLYDAKGALLKQPQSECFPDAPCTDNGLTPVACDTWEGFVFVNLDPQPRQALNDFLGPLVERLSGVPFDEYPYSLTLSSEIEGNWKFGVEAASEGYHVPLLHRNTVGGIMPSKDNPHLNYLHYEPLGAHSMAVVPRNTDFRWPEHRKVHRFAVENADQLFGEGDVSAKGMAAHPLVNILKTPKWQVDFYLVFPNFTLNIAPNAWWMTYYLPLSKDRSHWKTTYFFRKPTKPSELFGRRHAGAFQRDILTEDNCAFQRQQMMMESGGKSHIMLGEQEVLLRHFNAVVSTAIGKIG